MGTSATTLLPDQARLQVIERAIDTEFARDRLARALHDVIVDAVGFGPCQHATSEDREWIRTAVAIPIQEATEVALAVLGRRLGRVLETAPSELRDRFEARHRWEELGRE